MEALNAMDKSTPDNLVIEEPVVPDLQQNKTPARTVIADAGIRNQERPKDTPSPSPTQAPVSAFTNALETSPSGETTILEFAKRVRDGAYAEPVKLIRDATARGDKPTADRIKKTLPAFSLSGLVTQGARAKAFDQGRFRHSGWLQADFDKKDLDGKDPAVMRDLLANDPHVQFAFISPSGEGVKAIVKIPVCQSPDDHRRAFRAASEYFRRAYGLKLDESTKDPVRLCFASYDPKTAWNMSSVTPLRIPIDQSPKSPSPLLTKVPAISTDQAQREGVRLADLPELLRHIPTRPPYIEWVRICSAAWNEFGEDATPDLIAWSPEEKPGEYAEKFPQRLSEVGIGTIIMLAKEGGWQAAKARSLLPLCDGEGEDESPSFPMHCLPGAAGDMAREIARVTTSQNEPLAAAAVLGIASAACGGGINVSSGGERQIRANLFILPIAESGTGKGESFGLAAPPFETIEAEAIEQFDRLKMPGLQAELKVAEERSKRLCREAAKEDDSHAKRLALDQFRRAEEEKAEIQSRIESTPRYKVVDVTKEALAIRMAAQPGEAIASLSSEARGIMSIIKGRYSKAGGDEDFYCSGYSGDSVTVDRVGRPRVSLRHPCLTVLWMVQPDAARTAFGDEAMTESGLLPRFLTFDTKAEPHERFEPPAPIPSAIKSGWSKLIRSLTTMYRDGGDSPFTVIATPDGVAILDDYERENVRRRRSDGDLSDIASFVARWTENAWRLALVLHAAKNGDKAHHTLLDAATATNAVEVMRWYSERQLEILNAGRIERLQKRLSAFLAILAENTSGISLRDLRRNHAFSEKEITRLHEHSPKSFEIRKVSPEGGKGRPSLSAFLLMDTRRSEKGASFLNVSTSAPPMPKKSKVPKHAPHHTNDSDPQPSDERAQTFLRKVHSILEQKVAFESESIPPQVFDLYHAAESRLDHIITQIDGLGIDPALQKQVESAIEVGLTPSAFVDIFAGVLTQSGETPPSTE